MMPQRCHRQARRITIRVDGNKQMQVKREADGKLVRMILEGMRSLAALSFRTASHILRLFGATAIHRLKYQRTFTQTFA
jgi:hypothetical protein